jgi:hypothetical protein
MALEHHSAVERGLEIKESLDFIYSLVADSVIDAGGGVCAAFEDVDVQKYQLPNDLDWLRAGIILTTGNSEDLGLAILEHREDIFDKGLLELHLGLSVEKTTSHGMDLDYLKYLIKTPRIAQTRIIPWESINGKPGLKLEALTFDPSSKREISRIEEMWTDLRRSVLGPQAVKLIPVTGITNPNTP